ncbi:MAG: hypothetical protein R3B74_11190 [Nitrospirales bacterium]|nr:hypothetical protein [Nitrospirales bacterium]
MVDPNAPSYAKLVRLDETITRRKDESGIIRVHDSRIIWNNLERIDAYIYGDIEKAAVTEEYDWTAGRSQTEAGACHDECKRLFYIAAPARAGRELRTSCGIVIWRGGTRVLA